MRASSIVLGLAVAVAGCGGGTPISEVGVGDCFDDTDAALVAHLDIADCSQPHDNEVFAELLMGGTDWPGTAGIEDYAVSACLESFAPYVGASYAESPLDYFFLTPTEESWTNGDRSVLCVLYSSDLEKLIGSQRVE